MNDIILLKQGEIVLKGGNRRSFEDKLVANVRRRLRAFGEFEIYTMQSTVYVEPKVPNIDLNEVIEALKKVFGVAALSRARACEKDPDAIFGAARGYLGADLGAAGSFKVETKRADKRFPMTSIELSQYVGGLLADAFPDTRVDVHNPELTVCIEVRERAAYVHGNPIAGAGGLPVGVNGRAVTLLSGGIDSPVSSYLIARRGVQLIPVHFFSFPYTSQLAKEKVLSLAKLLTPWCGRLTVELVPFTKIQEAIRKKCPEEFFTVIMRRLMMRIAESIADSNGCKALVTGENLGQVASQTMEALRCTGEVVSLPVLRPLIGLDKQDIIEYARKIGTFETSILPYEDCCTVFTPRHPKTRPRLEDVIAAESALDVDALVKQALEGVERVRLDI
ncbi:MAG: tRNA 4-thiouridine(8) synthase ThiI [Oscillospiraceae bacterium]|jgi:thiamine biosynthesis protein ThiI|nr:tRNA 4-thiouridine(8) synthase ThiI [Oscillospiraceae bacterium]